MHNFTKTSLLMAAMTALFMGIGWLLGGAQGAVVAFGGAAVMNFISYWNADKIVLRLYRAEPAPEGSELHRIVAGLAQRAGMPMPKVYLIDNAQPNAFATGRNPENAAVAATTGLLSMLNEREIAGVMAHELAHIQNRDTLTMTITATLAGAIAMLANFAFFMGRDNRGGAIGALLVTILAPIAASLVQMAISRTREYGADRIGAEICGDPQALASALEKIEGAAHRLRNDTAERNPASGQMFIINPLMRERADNLFSTHPATANRVAELRKLVGSPAPSAVSPWNQPVQNGPWG